MQTHPDIGLMTAGQCTGADLLHCLPVSGHSVVEHLKLSKHTELNKHLDNRVSTSNLHSNAHMGGGGGDWTKERAHLTYEKIA